MDQIFALRQIVEKQLAVDKKVYTAFVDLEKAFDSVDRSMMWRVLEMYGVNKTLLNAIRAIYQNSRSCVRVDGEYSEYFDVYKGVRQGCIMSPWLFNLIMDHCVKQANVEEHGIQIGAQKVGVLLYADDAVLIANSAAELQTMISSLNHALCANSLKINASKTKVLIFDRKDERE